MDLTSLLSQSVEFFRANPALKPPPPLPGPPARGARAPVSYPLHGYRFSDLPSAVQATASAFYVPTGASPPHPILVTQNPGGRLWFTAWIGEEAWGQGPTPDVAGGKARKEWKAANAAQPTVRADDVLAARDAAVREANARATDVQDIQLTPEIRRLLNLPKRVDVALECWPALPGQPTALPHRLMMATDPRLKDPASDLQYLHRTFQAQVLYEGWWLSQNRPGCAPMVNAGVGQGKTLPIAQLPIVMGAQRPLLLVAAALEDQARADIERYASWGFRMPPNLTILTHEKIGTPNNRALLDRLDPDLILIDEADAFGSGDSARTQRVVAYATSKSPQVPVALFSATFLKDGLRNITHLCKLALGVWSPLPREWGDMAAIASAVDPDVYTNEGRRMRPGALLAALSTLDRMEVGEDPIKQARRAVRNIMASTPGYVTVPEHLRREGDPTYPAGLPEGHPGHGRAGERIPLIIRMLRPEVPDSVKDTLEQIAMTETNPVDGRVLGGPLEVYQSRQAASCGYVRTWTPLPPDHWKQARQDWARGLKAAQRAYKGRDWPDSPATWRRALDKPPDARGGVPEHVMVEVDQMVAPAPGAPPLRTPTQVNLRDLWETFKGVCRQLNTQPHNPNPPKPTVVEQTMVDDYLLRFATEWAVDETAGPGIVWTHSPKFALALSRHSGMPYYGSQQDTRGMDIRDEDGTRSVIASIRVNQRGKNLQGAFNRNLILQGIGSCGTLEQVIGRTHRSGQTVPVRVDFCVPTDVQESALAAALRRSTFVLEVENTSYRLYENRAQLTFSAAAINDQQMLSTLERGGGDED